MKFTATVAICCLLLAGVDAQSQCQADTECLNGGVCKNPSSTNSYCQCVSGFGGDDCANTCLKFCDNGGSCRFHEDISHGFHEQDGDAFCECPEGFVGVNCEIPYNLCPDGVLKCLHGGACIADSSNPSSYQCDCPGERTGDVCQYSSPDDPNVPPFECQTSSQCLNSGSCLQDGSRKVCQCTSGFGGEDCSSPACQRQCKNGGSCRFHSDVSHGSDQDGDTFCECLGDYLGVNCEIPFTLCPGDLKCLHGGTCQNGGGCSCPAPRAGAVCQFDSEEDQRKYEEDQRKNSSEGGDDKDMIKMVGIAVGGILVIGILTCLIVCISGRTRGKQPEIAKKEQTFQQPAISITGDHDTASAPSSSTTIDMSQAHEEPNPADGELC